MPITLKDQEAVDLSSPIETSPVKSSLKDTREEKKDDAGQEAVDMALPQTAQPTTATPKNVEFAANPEVRVMSPTLSAEPGTPSPAPEAPQALSEPAFTVDESAEKAKPVAEERKEEAAAQSQEAIDVASAPTATVFRQPTEPPEYPFPYPVTSEGAPKADVKPESLDVAPSSEERLAQRGSERIPFI